MSVTLTIRPARPEDLAPVTAFYPLAFPEEDLIPLVRALWNDPPEAIHLVAEGEDGPTGHIAFTICGIDGQTQRVALLGPLAVHPSFQKQGVGTSLIDEGINRLIDAKVSAVYVLGDPAYYGRQSFAPETNIKPPYPLPDEWLPAWQGRVLATVDPIPGRLAVPPAWQNPALWSE